MHALLILNEQAGTIASADAIAPEVIRDALAESGVTATVITAAHGALDQTLKDAVARRPEVIFVGGGDGTIATAAAHLAGTDIPLGVLPLGTLNHFAKDLGVPKDWRDAVRVLAGAPVRRVDVGEVNGRVFINNCSLGMYADAVRRRDALRQRHGFGKWRAMAHASWTVLRRLRRLRVQIATPEGTATTRTPFVLVSNNRYTGNVISSALRSQLDGGKLWVHTTRANGRFTMVRLVFQAMRRRLGDVDYLESRGVTEATIGVARGAIPVATDGELVHLEPPFHFRIRPRALCVLAPPAPPP